MITITSQSNALRIAKNDTITLFVEAISDVNNAVLSYSWKVKKNSVFQDVLNPSANTSNLEILPDAQEYGSYVFLCEIKELNEANQIISGKNSQEIQVTIFNNRVTGVAPSKARIIPKSDNIIIDSEYDLAGIFANGNEFGSPTLVDNRNRKNVESAIIDLASMQLLALPVGSLIKNRSGAQPMASTQESNVIVSGTVVVSESGGTVDANIFGQRVSIPDGTIDSQLTEIIFQILLKYDVDGIYINNVVRESPTRISFRYNDYKLYPEKEIELSGANISVVTTSEPSFVVGRWELLNSQEFIGVNDVNYTEFTWERVE
ncbi:baseplate wedge subunit and tail pin [Vibrio phage vB_VmeM-32]|nr:baseplate wedge subunit and tail pin [Vibrio phage vB_VmeM-32]